MTSRNVLTIHPSPAVRQQLRSQFVQEPVAEFSTRQEALSYLSKTPPALVVSHPGC